MKASIVTAILAATVAVTTVQAQEENPNKLMLGIGGLVAPSYPGSRALKSHVVPIIVAQKEITPGNLAYLRGLTAGVDHMLTDKLSIGGFASYRPARKTADDLELLNMSKVDAAVEIGPKVRYQATPQIGVEGQVAVDASGAHDGYTARIGGDYRRPLNETTMLTADAGLNYGSKQFNNAYYGVKPAQAMAGRPAYSPGGGFTSVDAGVGVTHALTSNWRLLGKLGADYLVGDVADSPIVKTEIQPKLMLGVAYSF
jgi:outer membrane scaffolding protein for murein synthesis (MipA/OmpV family)